MITTKTRTLLLQRMRAAYCDRNASASLALSGLDRKAADQLVIAGLANKTRDGRYEASFQGLLIDTMETV